MHAPEVISLVEWSLQKHDQRFHKTAAKRLSTHAGLQPDTYHIR